MNIQNLSFFDKLGRNLNLVLNATTQVWEGKIFFEGISTYLFDNENLFILEKIGVNYRFPALAVGQSLSFEWNSNQNPDSFFIYDVVKDITLNEQFINRVESKEIAHSDLDPTNTSTPLDLKFPLQVNIAFNPTEEKKYERTLNIFSKQGIVKTKIAEIYFYGEGMGPKLWHKVP
jgi:hypothetical protein